MGHSTSRLFSLSKRQLHRHLHHRGTEPFSFCTLENPHMTTDKHRKDDPNSDAAHDCAADGEFADGVGVVSVE